MKTFRFKLRALPDNGFIEDTVVEKGFINALAQVIVKMQYYSRREKYTFEIVELVEI